MRCAQACVQNKDVLRVGRRSGGHKLQMQHVHAWAGREKVQRSVLSVREGPTAEEVVGLAYKGKPDSLYVSWCCLAMLVSLGASVKKPLETGVALTPYAVCGAQGMAQRPTSLLSRSPRRWCSIYVQPAR